LLNKCDALGLSAVKLNGRTKPLVLECEFTEENIPTRKTLLVKSLGLPEITTTALYCEVLGNLLAREFGIDTPKPFLVDLSEDFVRVTARPLWEYGIKINAGVGVGCEYFSQGFTSISSSMNLTKEQLEQATLIYGFDLISQNPDRREHNPNCAVKGDKIVAYDFEKSLSFLYPIIGAKPKPWEFSKLNLSGNEKHVFRSYLLKAKEKEINWQPLIEKVNQIDKEKLEYICSLLPSEFGDYTEEVLTHFSSIVSNSNQLMFELQRSLL
jgi:hypothetical protein